MKEQADTSSIPDFAHSIAVNEYGFYSVPDAFATREVPKILANGEVYEPRTLKLMQRFCGTGDIVTGGAFIGDFLPALSRAVSEAAMVHSFEPNPISFQAARHTIALNSLSNVQLHQVGVGDTNEELSLQVKTSDDDSMAARAKIVDAPIEGQTIVVNITRLDDLLDLRRRYSVLHLDIEGHELSALSGAQGLIRKNKPLIVLEAPKPWQQRSYEKELKRLFPNLGYQFSGAMERNGFFQSATFIEPL